MRNQGTVQTLTLAVSVVLAAAIATPASVFAEGLVDLFAGASFTQPGDADVSLNGTAASGEAKHKTSLLVGGRAGWWFDVDAPASAGLNLDVSWFRPDFDPGESSIAGVNPVLGPFAASLKTDLSVVAIGINAMFRGQFLKDSEVTRGRLQPYVFAGPTAFISTFEAKFTLTAPGVAFKAEDSDTSVNLGLTAGGGLAFMFTRNIGLFGEYRFTHSSPTFELHDNGLNAKVEPTLNTHHLLGGLAIRF